MREIKFRAWHKGYIKKSSMRPTMLYDDNPGDCLVWQNQGQPIDIMQYTTLKDENGKEIYEGDIFKILAEPEEINVVTWDEGKYLLEDHGLWLSDWYKHGEIIGNIYENPELIK